MTCTRCVGAWSALGIVGLRIDDPQSGRIVTNVLAASALNDWLQAGFKLLTSESNQVEARVEDGPADFRRRTFGTVGAVDSTWHAKWKRFAIRQRTGTASPSSR